MQKWIYHPYYERKPGNIVLSLFPIHKGHTVDRINKLPWTLFYLLKSSVFFCDLDKIYIILLQKLMFSIRHSFLSGNLQKEFPRETEQCNPLTIQMESSRDIYDKINYAATHYQKVVILFSLLQVKVIPHTTESFWCCRSSNMGKRF